MTDILIEKQTDGGWDAVIRDGDLVLTANEGRLVEVGQRCVYATSTHFGESPYQTQAGVPYEAGVFGDEPAPAIAGFLRGLLGEVEGVDEVFDTEFVLDPDSGTLTITFSIRVGQDVGTFTLEQSA